MQDCCLQSGPVSDPFRFPLWLQCSTESRFACNRYILLKEMRLFKTNSVVPAGPWRSDRRAWSPGPGSYSEPDPKGFWPFEIRETFVSDPGFRVASNFTLLSSLVSLDLNEFLEPSRESLSVRRRFWTLFARVVARVLRCDTTRSARPLSWTLSAFDSARTP